MDKIDEILSRGVANVIPNKATLEKLLRSDKKLNVYLGIDPTATQIHIGNAVQLRKLQAFAELGHNVTFLIGDFTALIGDTSDKDTERPKLTIEQIQENFKTYKSQAEKILDFSKVTVRHNSEWLKDLTFTDVVKLCQHFSLGDFIGRELIKKRVESQTKIGLHEVLYPVMQGYDSYFLDTDIQLGGTDQTFNMQAGRTLQKLLRDKESFVLAGEFLEGTDGRKMSKSWGNGIWLNDEPNDMYGKVMSAKDELIPNYFLLATALPMSEVKEKVKRFEEGENPMDLKKELAWQIVSELHNKKDADAAAENFSKTFQEKAPTFAPKKVSGSTLIEAVAEISGISNSEAKRLISSGAIDVNGKTYTDPKQEIADGDEIKIGKREFIKVKK